MSGRFLLSCKGMADAIATADAGGEPALGPSEARSGGGADRGAERLGSFRVTILAVVTFMLLYVISVEGLERLLDAHFRAEVAQATRVSPTAGPVVTQIQQRLEERVLSSPWIRYGGVRVNVTVIGADGLTPLYVGGGVVVPPPPERHLDVEMREALDLLPAIADVFVSVPHGSALSTGLFVGYAALLLHGLFLFTRHVTRVERERLEAAVAARDRSAERARAIEEELVSVHERLRTTEPAEQQQSDEIRQLERERAELRHRLRALGERERALRTSATRAQELEEERQALEELLDEAMEDVEHKTDAIRDLEDRLEHASRKQAAEGRGRSKEAERVTKRLRTLYKNLDVEDRAISDLVALGDESLRLRAEEGLKRLDDDPDTAAVRRKVGGLPPQLSIFELGFAGKGRIYYSPRNERGGFRIVAIGGKASQKQDLEYLSRLSP